MSVYEHPVAPRYLEVDRQGIVFNMWYLAYFDDAFAGFLASRGLPYPQLLAQGYDASLVHTELDWTAGLAYGDRARIAVGVEKVGTTSFTLTFEVRREVADGEVADGEVADGEVADGEVADGEVADGDASDGDASDGVEGRVLCRGRTVYVCVGDEDGLKKEIPPFLRACLEEA